MERQAPRYPPVMGFPINFVVCVMFAQPAGGWLKAYTAPAHVRPFTSALGAPAITVSPSMAIDQPSSSLEAPSDAVRIAVCVVSCHPPGGSTNTAAAPISLPRARGYPTATVSPLIAKEVSP